MKKWDLVAIAAEVIGAVCTVVGFLAAAKKSEGIEDTVHRLMLEDKSNGSTRKN